MTWDSGAYRVSAERSLAASSCSAARTRASTSTVVPATAIPTVRGGRGPHALRRRRAARAATPLRATFPRRRELIQNRPTEERQQNLVMPGELYAAAAGERGALDDIHAWPVVALHVAV